jgi:hypothetical protein
VKIVHKGSTLKTGTTSVQPSEVAVVNDMTTTTRLLESDARLCPKRDHHSNNNSNTEEQTDGLFCSSLRLHKPDLVQVLIGWSASSGCFVLCYMKYRVLNYFFSIGLNLTIADIIC